MHETGAFFRLVWQRDRKAVAFFAILAIAGTLAAMTASNLLSIDSVRTTTNPVIPKIIVSGLMLLAIVPAAVSSLGLFNFQLKEEQLESPQSCCSHWLLRLPIRAWKIAIVPVAMKTCWIFACWYLLSFAFRQLGAPASLPLYEPALSLSAGAIWILGVSWRPFRSGWWRMGVFTVVLACVFAVMGVSFVSTKEHLSQWHVLDTIGTTVFYLVAVGFLIDSVRVARTNTMGIVPFRRRVPLTRPLSGHSIDSRTNHKGPTEALIWHDYQQSKWWIIGVIVLGVIPATIALSGFSEVGGRSFGMGVVFAMVLFGLLAAFPLSGYFRTVSSWDKNAVLPMYLISSPLSSRRIAWTRLAQTFKFQMPILLCVLFVFAAWTFFAENRQIWMRWADTLASQIGGEQDAFRVGLRSSIAIILAAIVATQGRMTSLIWVIMSGRPWIHVVMYGSMLVLVFGGGLVPLNWFFRYDNMDDIQAAAWWWVAWLPYLALVLLIIKVAFAGIAAVMLRHRRLATSSCTTRIAVMWAVSVALLGVILSLLIPDPRIGPLWCFTVSALMIPLGGILMAPIAVDMDRHR